VGSCLYAQKTSATDTASVALLRQSGTGYALYCDHGGLVGSLKPLSMFYQQSTAVSNNAAPAVYGYSFNIRAGIFQTVAASDSAYALLGIVSASGSFDGAGVYGYSKPSAGRGYGIIGEGGKFGVFAVGDVGASGVKPFVIDHPLDPENKILKHFSIESPEVLNVYRGNITLDNNGEAIVELPGYFSSINKEFSYVLTPIGAPANLYVKSEIDDHGKFIISGGRAGMKVSWYVYADRNDAYVRTHPDATKVESEKPTEQKGQYIMPELFGQPKNKAIFYKGDNQTPSPVNGNPGPGDEVQPARSLPRK
jgi:hypothetical protein